MSDRNTNITSKDKKILAIFGSMGIATAVALGGTAVYFTAAEEGREMAQNVAQDFRPVSLPESSLELTEVPEAPVGQLDSSDAAYINVDMQGREIDTDGDIQEVTNNGNATPSQGSNALPTAEEMRQVSNIGKRFVVDSVGLDVALGAMDEVDNLIRPTNFTNAFIVRNHGTGEDLTKAKNGTLYIAMHATDAGSIAPGNFLVDSTTKQGRVNPGDIIEVGKLRYKITGSKRAGKDLISQDQNVWDASVKGRLVVFTCMPNSADNFLIEAELVQ